MKADPAARYADMPWGDDEIASTDRRTVAQLEIAEREAIATQRRLSCEAYHAAEEAAAIPRRTHYRASTCSIDNEGDMVTRAALENACHELSRNLDNVSVNLNHRGGAVKARVNSVFFGWPDPVCAYVSISVPRDLRDRAKDGLIGCSGKGQ